MMRPLFLKSVYMVNHQSADEDFAMKLPLQGQGVSPPLALITSLVAIVKSDNSICLGHFFLDIQGHRIYPPPNKRASSRFIWSPSSRKSIAVLEE